MTNTYPGGAVGADRTPAGDLAPSTRIYVLLDRSGSMASIAGDVVGGFNTFAAVQKADGDDARLTLVQFDTVDPQEVVVDDAPIGLVPELTLSTFVPRGGTPLLDATGRIVARAQEHAVARKAAGLPAEHVLIVTITDGLENSSTELNRRQVLELIKAREADGWTFAFLSAALGAYDEAQSIGYDPRSVQAMPASPAGMATAFASVSASVSRRRDALRSGGAYEAGDLFEGDKPAEALLPDDPA